MRSDATGEESSTEAVDSFILQERTRSASVSTQIPRQKSVPRTLNARASLIIAANPRRSADSTPPTSPRTRTVSLGVRKDVSSQIVSTTQTSSTKSTALVEKQPSHDSSQDEEEMLREAEECAELEATRRFITDTMKRRNKPPARMAVGNVNFFDQPLSSAAASDFCVTENSTPCGSPPPERSMAYDVSFKEIALLKQKLKKLEDEVKYMRIQQQEMNNFYAKMNLFYNTLAREREEEKKCWF